MSEINFSELTEREAQTVIAFLKSLRSRILTVLENDLRELISTTDFKDPAQVLFLNYYRCLVFTFTPTNERIDKDEFSNTPQ